MTNYIGDWLLDIVSISTNRRVEEFDRERIEAIASSIVGLRGVIDPLIVRKTGYNADGEEQYELIDGHLQYFAAKRAMEIDPKLEMIRAFVIESGQEALFAQQINLLRSGKSMPLSQPVANGLDYQWLSNQLEMILNNRLTEFAKNISNELTKLKLEITHLITTSPPPPSPTAQGKITAQKFIELVNQLAEQELRDKLKLYPNSHKFLADLLKHRPFTSIKDIMARVPHFTKNTWDRIRQNWHG